ncbi:ROK family transcriptional regulator [Paractinoplanes ferrugineus]|uniref:Xylose repressor n=1 Tax=Paractinoplanes ferrugineus TaxID=113564 RepID=A0A919MA46_9ACTN|nr:ROK family protein [Actinoplanes ferrugineus]GIE08313.1 xylose repressor [Actinoplanes ferrugineus]
MTTRSTELLRLAHTRPGVTRADAARLLGLGTGAATEIVSRLAHASLLAEAPAPPSGGRGRPTTALIAHPTGPLVLAVAITHEDWRIDVVELGGATLTSVAAPHTSPDWAAVSASVTAAASSLRLAYGERLRAMGLSVPGTVSPDLRLDASGLGWHDVDLTALLLADASSGPHLMARGDASLGPLLVARNDASLAAAAESARGAAVGATVALHLRIEAGLGGAVVDHGRVLTGARGAGGEFGHMPFGDPAVTCPCGAQGCWGTAVDGTAMARLLGRPAPPDPVTYARRLISSTQPAEQAAVRAVAATLGRGIAGLVNGLDADLVTLGGLGADLLAAAPAEIATAYRAGLMRVHRPAPPPLLQAALGDDGPITGAGEEAWSLLLPWLT